MYNCKGKCCSKNRDGTDGYKCNNSSQTYCGYCFNKFECKLYFSDTNYIGMLYSGKVCFFCYIDIQFCNSVLMIMPACACMLISFSQLIKSYKHVPQKIGPLKTSCYTIVEVFTFIIVLSLHLIISLQIIIF